MRIAIVRLSALGDIIQSMIVVQFIKEKYPQSTIDWVVDKKFSEIVRLNNLVDNVLETRLNEIKKSKNIFYLLKHFAELRKAQKYDYVIDMQGLLKSAIISKIIPSNKTIGFDRKSSREPLSSFFYSDSFNIPYDKNVISRYCDLISKSLNIKISFNQILNKKPIFEIKQQVQPLKKLVAIIIGSSFGSKNYPLKNYEIISRNIDADFLCLWGTNLEFVKAKKLSDACLNVDVSKKTSLGELPTIIASSHLVIGGDTGPTHLAWALNIPSITLFGPTPGSRNMFETRINLKIESESRVDPLRIDKLDRSISEIDPKEIIKLAKKLL